EVVARFQSAGSLDPGMAGDPPDRGDLLLRSALFLRAGDHPLSSPAQSDDRRDRRAADGAPAHPARDGVANRRRRRPPRARLELPAGAGDAGDRRGRVPVLARLSGVPGCPDRHRHRLCLRVGQRRRADLRIASRRRPHERHAARQGSNRRGDPRSECRRLQHRRRDHREPDDSPDDGHDRDGDRRAVDRDAAQPAAPGKAPVAPCDTNGKHGPDPASLECRAKQPCRAAVATALAGHQCIRRPSAGVLSAILSGYGGARSLVRPGAEPRLDRGDCGAALRLAAVGGARERARAGDCDDPARAALSGDGGRHPSRACGRSLYRAMGGDPSGGSALLRSVQRASAGRSARNITLAHQRVGYGLHRIDGPAAGLVGGPLAARGVRADRDRGHRWLAPDPERRGGGRPGPCGPV
ncbi:MAG: hypothetical protein AVDCRST_MAG87-3390, partial [uncultured Thermomicrobiales bacterium]